MAARFRRGARFRVIGRWEHELEHALGARVTSAHPGMTARGPALFDPAAYGGHREVDLAMLRLFGSPSARFFDAYDEVYPRAPGHEDRVAFYQLYA